MGKGRLTVARGNSSRLFLIALVACSSAKKPSPRSPDAPRSVVATAGIRSAIVTWTAPASDGGAPILRYAVAVTATGSGGSIPIVSVQGLQANMTGLLDGTTYAFDVSAENAAGSSPKSSSNLVTTPPLPSLSRITTPGMVTSGDTGLISSVPVDAGVTVRWTIAGGTLTSPEGGTTSAGVNSVTWTAGLAGTATISCVPQNAVGTGLPGHASTTVIEAPAIQGFAADNAVVAPGASTTLRATFTGGTGHIVESGASIDSGGAFQTARIHTTTSYTLLVTNSLSRFVETTATIATTAFNAPAPSLGTGRKYQAAAMLADGETVLVTGGVTDAGTTSAELWTLAGGSTPTAGPPRLARTAHTATLLPNGKVLVANGWAGSTPTRVAELFDPMTSTFSETSGLMRTARTNTRAVRLDDGNILIAGGYAVDVIYGCCNYAQDAERYVPGTDSFAPTGSLNDAREIVAPILLTDGTVLVAGGFNGNAMAGAELYQPVTGTFVRTGSLITARFDHSVALLPGGHVLIAAGRTPPFVAGSGGDPSSSAEVYDQVSGKFKTTGSLNHARAGATAVSLRDGRVLVVGGMDKDGNALGSGEIYDPSQGNFTDVSGSLATPRFAMAAVLLSSADDDFVALLGGSTSGGGQVSKVELF